MNTPLAATLACDTIRNETSEMSDERVRRTGHIAILAMVLGGGTVSRTALTWMALERGISEAELSRHILRPLVQRGFVRTAKETISATAAAALHTDAIGAWMDGETLYSDRTETIRATAAKVRTGDAFEYTDARGVSHLVLCDTRSVGEFSVELGGHLVDPTAPVRIYRAA